MRKFNLAVAVTVLSFSLPLVAIAKHAPGHEKMAAETGAMGDKAMGDKAMAGEKGAMAEHGAMGDKAMMGEKNIVDTAVAAGDFKTLAKALTAAGLIKTLKGKGPFTVFAPTDEAFAKIPEADLKALMKDKAKLKKVLTYHVVAGKVLAADVAKMTSAKTVEGGELKITDKPTVKVNDANVTKTDIMASNGVIHVIDTVLMPQ